MKSNRAKRALLLAISHGLRSPLTRARVNAGLVSEGAHRDALLRDLGETRDLITDLLEGERLTNGHAALHTEGVDLAALAREADGQLRLAARDFGPAVTDEQLVRPAEPFYRADSARQRATGGICLGLYLCRLVAQAHGGTLQFCHAAPGLEVVARWPMAPAR